MFSNNKASTMITQFFILLIALIWLSTLKTNSSVACYELIITDVSLDNSSKYLDIDYKQAGRRMNVTINIKKQIDSIVLNCDILITALDSPPNAKYHSLMKKTLDICRLQSDPKYEPLIYPSYLEALHDKRNKIARKCPYQPDVYYVRNFEIDTKKFPPMVPNVRFQTKMKLDITYGSEKETLEHRIYGTLDNGAGKLLKTLG